MKNSKNKKFTCKGINNALALLESNRFEILSIDILKGGRAYGDHRLILNIEYEYFKLKIISKQV